MNNSGIFVVLYDIQTLKLYLNKGIYGMLMPPASEPLSSRSRHFRILGDYACIRKGTHIFFFLKRKIIYGGQAIGPNDHIGAFHKWPI